MYVLVPQAMREEASNERQKPVCARVCVWFVDMRAHAVVDGGCRMNLVCVKKRRCAKKEKREVGYEEAASGQAK